MVFLHRAFADAKLYASTKLAEADEQYLSEEYLALLAVEAATSQTTMVHGDDIPDLLPVGGGKEV